jgi:(E)-4-hydroxy-3-methylbut-2-enyl-diphosphate synthase
MRAAGCDVPLVADIHFKPDAAMEAVKWVEKVRVNPGNYADKKKFAVKEYTDDEYAAEVAYMEEQFVAAGEGLHPPGRAMRIGTNHGSLSDRIMNRHGDTPLGMVESALEFARIARAQGLPQLPLLDEGQQSEGHDRGLPPARRAFEPTRLRLELSDPPRRHRSR